MADSESLESSESLTSFDSVASLSSPELDDAVAAESLDQSATEADDVVVKEKTSSDLLADFNIFNAMLLASLLLILLATFLMFMEVSDYGGLFNAPWRTGSVGR